MTIEEYAGMTRRVIAANGFEDFLPTLCFPERKKILVLEGIPPEKLPQTRELALEWAEKKRSCPTEEFLLAIKENEGSFRIVHRINDKSWEKIFTL